jgi:hypothetical protein
MRYHVEGAFRNTGESGALFIEASTPENAERAAVAKGLLVSDIAAIEDSCEGPANKWYEQQLEIVRTAILADQRCDAIRAAQVATGLDFYQASDFVGRLETDLRRERPTQFTQLTSPPAALLEPTSAPAASRAIEEKHSRLLASKAEECAPKSKLNNNKSANGAVGAVLIALFVWAGCSALFSTSSSSNHDDNLTYEQRKAVHDQEMYRAQLRATSDRTGYSMDDLDSAAKGFRAKGVGESDSERLRAAEEAFRLKEALNNP